MRRAARLELVDRDGVSRTVVVLQKLPSDALTAEVTLPDGSTAQLTRLQYSVVAMWVAQRVGCERREDDWAASAYEQVVGAVEAATQS